MLYSELPALDAAQAELILAQLVGSCSVEWASVPAPGVPLVAGVSRFGEHQIAMVALNTPVRQEVLARTVGVSPMPDEQRRALMAHRAAMRLLYLEGAVEPVEQLTALYQVATVMLSQGGLGIVNERAALAQPTELLVEYLPLQPGETPPMPLWVGVVTFNLEDEALAPHYLMRTYGMEQFGLPDLGLYVRDRSLADDVYHTLLNVCLYMVEGGMASQPQPGTRTEFKGHTYLFTAPGSAGVEFASPTGLLLLVEV